MRFLILLLFCTTAISVVSAVRFAPEALYPDLPAIANYFKKGDQSLMAYVNWPKSVTFKIRWIKDSDDKDGGYLKIDGTFKIVYCRLGISQTIEELYFKNRKFQIKKPNGSKLHGLSWRFQLQYYPPPMEQKKPYVSIRYFNYKEIHKRADRLYQEYKEHFSKVLYRYPAVFLASTPTSDGHFVEYTYMAKDARPYGIAMRLRWLRGTGNGNGVSIKRTYRAEQLIYNQGMLKKKFFMPIAVSLDQNPCRKVFGVRMENAPFLAEVRESGTRMFSNKDLRFSTPFTENPEFSTQEIMAKAAQVEPRLKYKKKDYSPKVWPTGIRFQVKGVIFTKSVNFHQGVMSPTCPIVIEKEDKGKIFLDKKWVPGTKLCSNDRELWPMET